MDSADRPKNPGRSTVIFIYVLLGAGVGVYLVYLILDTFGTAESMDRFNQLLPASVIAVGWFVLPLLAATQSWLLLFPVSGRPDFPPALRWTWIGLGANWLLPVAMVGGEVIKFRLALPRTKDASLLVATLVGDKTIQVLTQLLYVVAGLILLALYYGGLGGGSHGVGLLLVFGFAVFLFYRLQTTDPFSRLTARLGRWVRDNPQIRRHAKNTDHALKGLYRRRRLWWLAVLHRIGFRLLMAFEIWLGLWWLGYPVSWLEAVILESIGQGARAAGFFIPAGVGVQEGGIVAVGLLMGYPGESLIAVAMMKRVRELAVGGSALLVWQLEEARLLKRGIPETHE